MLRRTIWILWPSFLAAGMAEAAFFTAFDPDELAVLWRVVPLSRTAIYSVGFLLFWFFAAVSSALTALLQRSSEEVNRCPLEPQERPAGCPKRAGR